MTPEERTAALLRNLDNALTDYPDGGMTHDQLINTLHWINENLERPAVKMLVRDLDLINADAICGLLDEPYFVKQ